MRQVQLQHNLCILCPSTCLTPFDPRPNQAARQRRRKQEAVRGGASGLLGANATRASTRRRSERARREELFPWHG